jgi:hypothetical protein
MALCSLITIHMLVQDIGCHIHSLIPMRDSARVACVSRTFQNAWLQHPNLILTRETLGFTFANGDITRSFTSIVDQILKKHSGNGMTTLELDISDCHDLNPCYLNDWLQIGITPGIENVNLMLPPEFKLPVLTFVWWEWKLDSSTSPHPLCLPFHGWHWLLDVGTDDSVHSVGSWRYPLH